MSLIDELKRRNVFKVTGAYLALGWVVVQATATLTPAFHLPESALPLVTWIGVIGFPFVVAFAWIYELTPEGLKREREVDRSQSITHLTSKRLDWVIIGMLSVAMLMFAADRFLPHGEPQAVAGADSAAVGAGPARDDARADSSVGAGHARDSSVDAASTLNRAQGALPQEQTSAAMAPDDKSIAVLPFVNMSSDTEQEYFSDGIAEELLNLLAQIPQLKVAARTSSFSFKGKDTAIPEIARQLRVAHVLEGSVRKSGSKVRITAQLIRAEDGYHLWSQTWDRELADVFVVQDEIAGAVVGQLKLTLLSEAPKARAIDPEAYSLLLNARQLFRIGSAESLQQSIALYQQALEIDVAYAEAWDGLAENYIYQAIADSLSADLARRLAMDALERALAHDPELAPAHQHLGKLALTLNNDLASAATHYERALQKVPDSVDVMRDSAQLMMALGRMDEALRVIDHVVRQDPLNPLGHYIRGVITFMDGNFLESVESNRNALSVVPDYEGSQTAIAQALLEAGNTEGALLALQAETSREWRHPAEPYILYRAGHTHEAEAALRELIADPAGWSVLVAAAEIARGDADSAFDWLERAASDREIALYEIAYSPQLKTLHSDPRWLPFLRKIGMAPEQLAAIPFEVKLPQ